jgi:hypothetical protein
MNARERQEYCLCQWGLAVSRSVALLSVLLFGNACSAGQERATVRLQSASEPRQDAVLESGLRINVSHVDATWKSRWNEGGGERVLTWTYAVQTGFAPHLVGIRQQTSFDNKAAELWVNLARSRLQGGIQDRAGHAGIKLVFVDRDNIKDIVRESDLGGAGITEEIRPTRAKVKVLDVDAKVYGKIDVDVKIETGTRNTVQSIWGGFARHYYWPYGWHAWGGVGFGERQKIRRIITVGASFMLEDAKTGEIYVQHQSAAQPIDTAKPGVFFGSNKHPIDLKQPDEQIVMAFLEQEVDRFVDRLVPGPSTLDVIVVSSSHGDCKRGVKALAVGDYAAARAAFEASLHDHSEDHQACFGAGVACEALGDYGRAAEYYHLAIEKVGGKPAPEYHAGHDRVGRRMAQANARDPASGAR